MKMTNYEGDQFRLSLCPQETDNLIKNKDIRLIQNDYLAMQHGKCYIWMLSFLKVLRWLLGASLITRSVSEEKGWQLNVLSIDVQVNINISKISFSIVDFRYHIHYQWSKPFTNNWITMYHLWFKIQKCKVSTSFTLACYQDRVTTYKLHPKHLTTWRRNGCTVTWKSTYPSAISKFQVKNHNSWIDLFWSIKFKQGFKHLFSKATRHVFQHLASQLKSECF